MNLARLILEGAAIQQDYGWFCVSLLWLAALAAVIGCPATGPDIKILKRWAWMTILAGLAGCLGEMVMHATPTRPPGAERISWDLGLSAGALGQALALVYLLLKLRPDLRRWLAVVGVGMVVTWVLRRSSPLSSNAALAAAGTGVGAAALASLRRKYTDSPAVTWLGGAALLAGLAPAASTTGFFAEVFAQQRRWTELSLLGPPAVAFQGAMSWGVIMGFLRVGTALRVTLESDRIRRELRALAVVLAVWIVVGFALAAWTGRVARHTFEESLLARARAAVFLVDPLAVARVLGPEFKIEAHPSMTQQSGRRNPVARAPFLLKVFRETADDLARVDAANPGIQWSHLMTFRGEFVVSCVFSSQLNLVRDSVGLHHEITAQDRRAWAERQVFFEGPIIGGWGELVRARAPIIHPQAGMLGWVALDFGASEWTAVQALARLQTFALVGAGSLLMLLVVLQRLRAAEHDAMRQRASSAHAADRAKTAFLAKVSHELRTPIQSILGYGELLSQITLTGDGPRWLAALRSHGLLLTRLVNDLLDLSALQSGAFRLVPHAGNLTELVVATTDSLRTKAADKGLDLLCDVPPGAPLWCIYDPERIRQVLLNLVNNAIKFTAEGRVCVVLRPVADGVEISVADTGPGICLEDQARLFRPFGRLNQTIQMEGAGLGLALSQALCHEMGGAIDVQSDGRTGSTFTIRVALPTANATTAPAEPAADRMGARALVGSRILVADDNTLVRELFLTGLRQAGAWCDAATDGLEAVELCAHHAYDVVVLDLSMPWLDGLEVARRIRGTVGQAGPRIIGVSAHAGSAEQNQAQAVGMEAMLVKPVSLGALVAAVAKTAGGPQPVSAALDLPLLRQLRMQFCEEADRLRFELTQALAAKDRRWLRSRAHYLKNSADVAGYPELSLLCGRLEDAVTAFGGASSAQLPMVVREIEIVLGRILSQGAPLSSAPPDDAHINP